MAAAMGKGPRLETGAGCLDLGLVAAPDLVGGGARLDWRLADPITAFAIGEVGYSPALERWDWLAMAGLRWEWGKNSQ